MFETKKELASLGGAFTSAGLSQMDARTQRQTGREMGQVRSRAVVAATVEQGRGFVAELALNEVRSRSALLPIRVLRSRDRTGAYLISLCIGTALFGMFFFLTLFVQGLALNEVGSLSALETHLLQVAPLGEARYKHIVDAYAMGAARTIARFS